jgi:hypothetical protein
MHKARITFERSDGMYEGGAVPMGQPTRRTVEFDLPDGPWLSAVYGRVQDQDGRFIAQVDDEDWYLEDDEYPWSDVTIEIVEA